jgi:hypothetical protein
LFEHFLSMLVAGVAMESGVQGCTQSEYGWYGEQDVESGDFPEEFGPEPGQVGAFAVFGQSRSGMASLTRWILGALWPGVSSAGGDIWSLNKVAEAGSLGACGFFATVDGTVQGLATFGCGAETWVWDWRCETATVMRRDKF